MQFLARPAHEFRHGHTHPATEARRDLVLPARACHRRNDRLRRATLQLGVLSPGWPLSRHRRPVIVGPCRLRCGSGARLPKTLPSQVRGAVDHAWLLGGVDYAEQLDDSGKAVHEQDHRDRNRESGQAGDEQNHRLPSPIGPSEQAAEPVDPPDVTAPITLCSRSTGTRRVRGRQPQGRAMTEGVTGWGCAAAGGVLTATVLGAGLAFLG